MVDGGVAERIERALRRISVWRGRPVTAAESAVRRLRCLAEEVDRRRDSAAGDRVLERGSGRGSGAVEVASRPPSSSDAELCWGVHLVRAGRKVGLRVERVEPAARNNAVYDIAGRLGRAAGATVRTGGYRHRYADSQSRADRD